MKWQRARQPEQKAERVKAILRAAGELFDVQEFTEISMTDVAKQSGIGKASVYQYFNTKEEVFLSLYQNEVDDWLSEVESRLGRMRHPNPARVAEALCEILCHRPRFCRLSVIFSFVLERNVSDAFLLQFKKSLLSPLSRFIKQLQGVIPSISDEQAKDFLFQHHALVAGMWPFAHPSVDVRRVMQAHDLQDLSIDFFPLLARTLTSLLSNYR